MSAAGRKTASALIVGDKVRVERRDYDNGERIHNTRKVGAKSTEVATITGISATMTYGGRRGSRRYDLETDLGSLSAAPGETFGIVQ